MIYHAATPATHTYTLRKGIIKLTKHWPMAAPRLCAILCAGDLFGFDGFADEPYNHTAVALAAVEVCRLPLTELVMLKEQHIEVDNALTVRWIQHLREAEDMMLELGAKRAPERLASFLIRWYRRNDEAWVLLPLSRAEIGELLGLTIETVSRFLSEWKRRGLLDEQRKQIRILDCKALQELACQECV
ncbi:MAG: Crp/Fnr family transcriptional regulator [Thiolinea sp.]